MAFRGEDVRVKVLAVVAAASMMLTSGSPALAETSQADLATGCVSFGEFESDPLAATSFRQLRIAWGVSATKRANPEPSSGLSMSAARYVTFDYPACDGATLYVVYERPSKRHNTRDWVLMMWDPTAGSETVLKR